MSRLLLKSYPRLTRPPLNLQTDEMLGAVVDRLLKALQEVRPTGVRQFLRWRISTFAGNSTTWPAASIVTSR
ncbi:MAG: hypothetical protein QM775_11805 [Pirellulales bacterium]